MILWLPNIYSSQRVPGAREGQRRTAHNVFLQVVVSLRHPSVYPDFVAHPLDRFHSSRYPTKPADTAHKFDPTENDHIVFVRKNKFFEVPLAYNGVELSEAELQVYVFVHVR